MAQFIEFLSSDALSSEPVSLDEVKTQARIDLDLTDDDLFIQTVIIPGARQQAETRTGSAIRAARFRQVFSSFPHGHLPLTLALGHVLSLESITYVVPEGVGVSAPRAHAGARARQTMDAADLELVTIDRESVVSLARGHWPHVQWGARAVEVGFTAGLDPQAFADRYPSVKAWILMACAWGYSQREMFLLQTRGAGYQELPVDYMSALLEPLKLPPRW